MHASNACCGLLTQFLTRAFLPLCMEGRNSTPVVKGVQQCKLWVDSLCASGQTKCTGTCTCLKAQFEINKWTQVALEARPVLAINRANAAQCNANVAQCWVYIGQRLSMLLVYCLCTTWWIMEGEEHSSSWCDFAVLDVLLPKMV